MSAFLLRRPLILGMPPKKRKAADKGESSGAPSVFVLTSVAKEDVNVIGCFNAWSDVVAAVETTMEKDPVDLYYKFEFCENITKEIKKNWLKKEWTRSHGLPVAVVNDDECSYTFTLYVYRTTLQ